jgi:hypothetical protein
MNIACMILFGLVAVALVGALVCFVLVLSRMFQQDRSTLAVVCAVAAWFSGLGLVIAFVYGWLKASEWSLRPVMLTWTGCLGAAGLFYGVFYLVMWLSGS